MLDYLDMAMEIIRYTNQSEDFAKRAPIVANSIIEDEIGKGFLELESPEELAKSLVEESGQENFGAVIAYGNINNEQVFAGAITFQLDLTPESITAPLYEFNAPYATNLQHYLESRQKKFKAPKIAMINRLVVESFFQRGEKNAAIQLLQGASAEIGYTSERAILVYLTIDSNDEWLRDAAEKAGFIEAENLSRQTFVDQRETNWFFVTKTRKPLQ